MTTLHVTDNDNNDCIIPSYKNLYIKLLCKRESSRRSTVLQTLSSLSGEFRSVTVLQCRVHSPF